VTVPYENAKQTGNIFGIPQTLHKRFTKSHFTTENNIRKKPVIGNGHIR
jgi:hypothetical protein